MKHVGLSMTYGLYISKIIMYSIRIQCHYDYLFLKCKVYKILLKISLRKKYKGFFYKRSRNVWYLNFYNQLTKYFQIGGAHTTPIWPSMTIDHLWFQYNDPHIQDWIEVKRVFGAAWSTAKTAGESTVRRANNRSLSVRYIVYNEGPTTRYWSAFLFFFCRPDGDAHTTPYDSLIPIV